MPLQPPSPIPLQRQKNMMPVQLASGEFYRVTDVAPLTVVQPDLRTGACRVVHREGSHPAVAPRGASVSRSAVGGGSDRGSSSSSTPSNAAAFNGAAAFAGVLGGGHVHGGSPFVHVGEDLYIRCAVHAAHAVCMLPMLSSCSSCQAPGALARLLAAAVAAPILGVSHPCSLPACSVVHHKRHLPYGGIYTHHLTLLRATPGRFRVEWLSEAFRWGALACHLPYA